jgi:hypothetical protein
MAISHADHDHPATPAARAACRKAMATGAHVNFNIMQAEATKPRGAARLVGVAKANGRGFRSFAINNEGDLAAEVPHVFSNAIRHAWEHGWQVRSADPYNDTEKRVTITSDHGQLALVYKSANPNGVWGVFWRPAGSSLTSRIEAAEVGIVNEGIRRLGDGV